MRCGPQYYPFKPRVVNKIISYALWGNDLKYIVGAKKNIELAKTYFPGWKIKLYVSTNTNFEYESDNLEIIRETETQPFDGMFWRFQPLDTNDTVIIRDLDDRLSERHRFVVDEWLASDKDIHIIKDHPSHTAHVLGGLWGVRNGFLKNLKALQRCEKRDKYGSDELFLSNTLWNPNYFPKMFIHDAFYRKLGIEHQINRRRENYEFLGDAMDENDVRYDYWKLIKQYE